MIPERLRSRKLWTTIAGLLGNVLLAYAKQIDWSQAINNCVMLIAAYVAVQGYVDSKQ